MQRFFLLLVRSLLVCECIHNENCSPRFTQSAFAESVFGQVVHAIVVHAKLSRRGAPCPEAELPGGEEGGGWSEPCNNFWWSFRQFGKRILKKDYLGAQERHFRDLEWLFLKVAVTLSIVIWSSQKLLPEALARCDSSHSRIFSLQNETPQTFPSLVFSSVHSILPKLRSAIFLEGNA